MGAKHVAFAHTFPDEQSPGSEQLLKQVVADPQTYGAHGTVPVKHVPDTLPATAPSHWPPTLSCSPEHDGKPAHAESQQT